MVDNLAIESVQALNIVLSVVVSRQGTYACMLIQMPRIGQGSSVHLMQDADEAQEWHLGK